MANLIAHIFGCVVIAVAVSGCSEKPAEDTVQKTPDASEISILKDFSKYIVASFEELGSDPSYIKEKTNGYTVSGWSAASITDVTIAGASACAIPASGLVTIPAELTYLMRELYNSALGVGFLYGVNPSKDDFAIILGIWSDEIMLDEEDFVKAYAASAGMAAYIEDKYGFDIVEMGGDILESSLKSAMEHYSEKTSQMTLPAGMPVYSIATGQLISHPGASVVLSHKVGAKVGGKVGSKVALKVGAKMGAKYGIKGVASLIPVVSLAACGGINAYIMNGMLDAAQKYYRLTSYSRKMLDIEILSADGLAK